MKLLKSMTGFGYAEGEYEGGLISVGIKTVNSRFLDVFVSSPAVLLQIEGQVRTHIKKRFRRGRIEITIEWETPDTPSQVSVNRTLARQWKEAFLELKEIAGQDEPALMEFLSLRKEIFQMKNIRPESIWNTVETLLTAAADRVEKDRIREGRELQRDIEQQITEIEKAQKAIEKQIPIIRKEVESSLRQRFSEVLGEGILEEQRILQETAAWIVKTDINEEIVRLKVHLCAFRECGGEEKGKRLDFIAQEMGREINTIGSKCSSSHVSIMVVSMKDALEKIREQLRNVE